MSFQTNVFDDLCLWFVDRAAEQFETMDSCAPHAKSLRNLARTDPSAPRTSPGASA